MEDSAGRLLDQVWGQAAGELARLVSALGVDAGRAEDLLQDVYLVACQKRPAGLDAADLRRWLFRVAANRCHLEHRRRTRWTKVLAKLPGWHHAKRADDPGEAASRDDEREAVRRALTGLEPLLHTVLVMRYFMELDSKEIGRILEMPDATVRSHLREARAQLALALKRSGWQDE